MAACHLREGRRCDRVWFLVIWQLRACGRKQAVRDALPGHPLTRHIDDFLAYLANANKPQHAIRAYRGNLIGSPAPAGS